MKLNRMPANFTTIDPLMEFTSENCFLTLIPPGRDTIYHHDSISRDEPQVEQG